MAVWSSLSGLNHSLGCQAAAFDWTVVDHDSEALASPEHCAVADVVEPLQIWGKSEAPVLCEGVRMKMHCLYPLGLIIGYSW